METLFLFYSTPNEQRVCTYNVIASYETCDDVLICKIKEDMETIGRELLMMPSKKGYRIELETPMKRVIYKFNGFVKEVSDGEGYLELKFKFTNFS